MSHEGGCLCGAVRYRVEGEPSASGICHCATCRKAASSTSLPFSTFRTSDFKLLRGTPTTFRSSPQVVRSFCGRCGAPLTYLNESDPGSLDVMTCSLDQPDAFPPDYSVWSSMRVAWDVPNPTCPSFPRSRSEGLDP